MKKLLLSLMFVTFCGLQAEKAAASDIGQLFLDESDKDLQQEMVASKAMTMCGHEKVAQLLKAELSENELVQIKELLPLFLKLLTVSTSQEFTVQFKKYAQLEFELQKNPIQTQEEQEAFVKRVMEECPLVVESLELSEQLKFFQAGLLKGIQPALEGLLEYL